MRAAVSSHHQGAAFLHWKVTGPKSSYPTPSHLWHRLSILGESCSQKVGKIEATSPALVITYAALDLEETQYIIY